MAVGFRLDESPAPGNLELTGAASPDRHAVVLAGGGANGSYALGVMEALFDGRWHRGRAGRVDASIFTGTSVGAFTAALMASLFDRSCLAAAREVRRLWLERISAPRGADNGVYRIRGDLARRAADEDPATYPAAFLNRLLADVSHLTRDGLQRGLDLASSGEPVSQRLLRLFDTGVVISTRPFKELVARSVDPRRLLNPRARTLKVIATNWDQGRAVVFHNRSDDGVLQPAVPRYERKPLTEDNACLAIRASAAIPSLFPWVQIDDHLYVDGGVIMNAPLQPAIKAGGSILHVIHFEPKLDPIPFGRVPSLFETLSRMTQTVPAEEVKEDLIEARRTRDLRAAALRLRCLGKARGSHDPDPALGVLRDYAKMPEITVHVHYPSQPVGGITGFLDFSRERIIRLIELGYDDAVAHDCEANGCVV